MRRIEVLSKNIIIDKKLGKALKAVVGKDEYRDFLCYVNYDPENMVLNATDGKHLLQINIVEDLKRELPTESQYYDIAETKKNTFLVPITKKDQYPDITRIINGKEIKYDNYSYNITNRHDFNATPYYHMQKAIDSGINFYNMEKVLKNLGSFGIYHNNKTIVLKDISERWIYVAMHCTVD